MFTLGDFLENISLLSNVDVEDEEDTNNCLLYTSSASSTYMVSTEAIFGAFLPSSPSRPLRYCLLYTSLRRRGDGRGAGLEALDGAGVVNSSDAPVGRRPTHDPVGRGLGRDPGG